METFLIEIFTKLFSNSGSPLLVFLTPILAPVMGIAVIMGIGATILVICDKITDIYYDSEAYARKEERAYRRSLQRALDLWQHGYIEFWVKRLYSDTSVHYVERKELHEGDDYWKASLIKAHKAHTLGMVANKKLPRGLFLKANISPVG